MASGTTLFTTNTSFQKSTKTIAHSCKTFATCCSDIVMNKTNIQQLKGGQQELNSTLKIKGFLIKKTSAKQNNMYDNTI